MTTVVPGGGAKGREASAVLARRYLASRRKRDAMGANLFSNPAFDILLDLFAASVEGSAVSVSSACLGSNCAVSTAILWVRKLEQAGLVRRAPDARDRRRTYLEITPVAVAAIEQWLDAVFSGPDAGAEP